MATLRLTLKGETGTILVQAFLAAVDNSLRILAEYDAAISEERRGTLDWVVRDLGIGSAMIELQSLSRDELKNAGPEVVELFTTGLGQIERTGLTPPYLSEAGLESTRRLVKLIGRYGTEGLIVTNLSTSTSVTLTARAAVNTDQLLLARRHALGSVEGKLEMISLRRQPRFVVYLTGSRKAVTCKFDARRFLDDAKDALGRRVLVSGVIFSNAKGEPLRVHVSGIRVLRSEEDLPSVEEMRASMPDFTGELATEEHIRKQRFG